MLEIPTPKLLNHNTPNQRNNKPHPTERGGVRAPDRAGLRLAAVLGAQRHRAAAPALRLPPHPRRHARPRQELLLRQPDHLLATGGFFYIISYCTLAQGITEMAKNVCPRLRDSTSCRGANSRNLGGLGRLLVITP